MRKIEPISLIILIIGLVLGITGITLAIVFGVQHGKSCPVCPACVTSAPPPATDCTAHLFTVRTGITDAKWNDNLQNTSSKQFQTLADKTSVQLQASLQASLAPPSSSLSAILLATAVNTTSNVVVQVTKFIQADDKITVIAVASAGIAGPALNIQNLDPNIDTTMQDTLTKDNKNYTDPTVNNDSMAFCQNPFTNLSETATQPPSTAPPQIICSTPSETTCPPPPEPTLCPIVTSEAPVTVCPKPEECNCTTDATLAPFTACPSPSVPTDCNCPVETTFTPFTACPSPPEPTACNCPIETTMIPLTACPSPPEPTACNCPIETTMIPLTACPSPPEPTACNCPSCPDVTTVAAPTACPTNPPSTSAPPQPSSSTAAQTSTTALPAQTSTLGPVQTSTAQQTTTVDQQTSTGLPPSSTVLQTSPTIPTTSAQGSSTIPATVPSSTVQASSTVVTTNSPSTNGETSPTVPPTSTIVTSPVTGTSTPQVSSTAQSSVASTSGPTTQTITGSTGAQSSAVQQSTSAEVSSTTGPQSSTASVTQTSGAPSTSSAPLTTVEESTAQTTTGCPGYSVYKGDIAIVYEQLSSKVVPQRSTSSPGSSTTPEPPVHYIDIELFIASQLIGFGGNPYDLPGGNTRALLAPYPKTTSYSAVIQANYAGSPKSVAQLNSTMYQANAITVATPADFTDAVIADGLTEVQKANDHAGNYGVLVIIGFSADFVAGAKQLATDLGAGYHIFTISFDPTQDFSSLASDAQSAITLKKPSDPAEARGISMQIAQFAVSQSSLCITTSAPTTVSTTTALPSTSIQTTVPVTTTLLTTSVPMTTTEYCPNKYLNQDIAIVWEESKSTGDFTVSDNVNSFLQILLPKIAANFADSTDTTWSSITNLSLVEYPGPDQYGTLGQFGTVSSVTYNGYLQYIEALGPGLANNLLSDINAGLTAAQTQFGALSSGRKQTIILFTNVGTEVGGAIFTASNLKNTGVTILTVAAVSSPGATIPLHDLSSGSAFEFNLDTTNQGGFSGAADRIVQSLTTISTQCCLTPDCYVPTTLSTAPSTTVETTVPPTQTTEAITSSSAPISTTAAITTTAIPTTSVCNGNTAFNGDISIIYELTVDDINNGKEAQLQSFISNRLLAYPGYQIDGVTSRVLLSPYGATTTYYVGNPGTYGRITSMTEAGGVKALLDAFNNMCTANGVTSTTISDGLDFTSGVTDHGTRNGVAVIMGYSDSDVFAAQAKATALKAQGYHVFTVSFDPTKPLNSLASDTDSAFTRNSVADEAAIAQTIGDYLMILSTVCVAPMTTPLPTTTTTFTTTFPPTTTEYCPIKYINQDIAVVWEESNSNGAFTVSDNVNSFLQVLLPKLASNLADSTDPTWSSVTNLSLVEYPNPAQYANFGPFGTITSQTLPGFLEIIKMVGAVATNSLSDINTGLTTAQTEFAALSSGRKQTIILFTNVATGIGAAIDTADQMKTSGATILTVAAVTGPTATIDMSRLSSGDQFEFTLDTSNAAGFNAVSTKIVQALATVSTQCCLTTDCPTSQTTPAGL